MHDAYRYHAGATTVLMAGVVGGIAAYLFVLDPVMALAGFAAASGLALVVIAAAYAFLDGTGSSLDAFRRYVADEDDDDEVSR